MLRSSPLLALFLAGSLLSAQGPTQLDFEVASIRENKSGLNAGSSTSRPDGRGAGAAGTRARSSGGVLCDCPLPQDVGGPELLVGHQCVIEV